LDTSSGPISIFAIFDVFGLFALHKSAFWPPLRPSRFRGRLDGYDERLGAFPTPLGPDLEELVFAFDDLGRDDVLAALLLVGQVVHQVEHDLFAHRTQGAGAGVALEGALGDELERLGRKLDLA